MIKELQHLLDWGDAHKLEKMTIPEEYIGHAEFLEKGIIQEWYTLTNKKNAEKWILEDVLSYKDDKRVHILRTGTSKQNKTTQYIIELCMKYNIIFAFHNSNDRLSDEDLKKYFIDPIDSHVIIIVKGFYRRADLWPNQWKVRIGATHDFYTKKPDNNTLAQSFPGRTSGYWASILRNGHRTGPYRTSVKAIQEYVNSYDNPYGNITYKTSTFTMKKGNITKNEPTLLSAKNVANLDAIDLPAYRLPGSMPIVIIENITDAQKNKFSNQYYMLNTFLREYNENIYNTYKSYIPHCWKMNTSDKCDKWGLKTMMKKDAYSTETNISIKTQNEIMFYLYEDKIIINPWNGEAIKDDSLRRNTN